MVNQRWAVVGTGAISRSVVPDLASCDGVEVVTIHSRTRENAEAFASEFNIPRATSDLSEVLGDETISSVYIATPFATHFEIARQCIIAGKHVLVEKPMAMSEAEVTELFALASEHHVFLMEAMWMKFNPGFRALIEEIRAGTIGSPRNLRAGFSMPFPDDGGGRWDVARSGGALLDQGIYPVTLAHCVFGTPQFIHAMGITRPDGLDLTEHFTLEFDGGRYAQCNSGMTEFSDPTAAISGTEGWIVIPGMFWVCTAFEIHAGDWESMMISPRRVEHHPIGNGYVPMVRAVSEAIRDGTLQHPLHDAAATIAVFSTLDAIRLQLINTSPPPR